eukprot:TRINITY_DN57803_c0_g1_i2.p1 TRINITY_DN57803_c0_g1~~TRINITY_DN57803_c0_g1_i2.p1  ORF type:complete len:746 (+),score=75.66 TRINITY_DN57803_c0_g1_i2:176-2413(+)
MRSSQFLKICDGQQTTLPDTPMAPKKIVVIGMGVAALTLAADLTRRDVDFVLLDTNSEDNGHFLPSVVLHPPTCDVLDRLLHSSIVGDSDSINVSSLMSRRIRKTTSSLSTTTSSLPPEKLASSSSCTSCFTDGLRRIAGERLFADNVCLLSWQYDFSNQTTACQHAHIVSETELRIRLMRAVDTSKIRKNVKIDKLNIGHTIREGCRVMFHNEKTGVSEELDALCVVATEPGTLPNNSNAFLEEIFPVKLLDMEVDVHWTIAPDIDENGAARWTCIRIDGDIMAAIPVAEDRWRILLLKSTPQDNNDTIISDNSSSYNTNRAANYEDTSTRRFASVKPTTPPFGFNNINLVETIQTRIRQHVLGAQVRKVFCSAEHPVTSWCAESFINGASFLIGEAAYSMPPIGSQCVNMAIHDAINLAWKLSLVSNGSAFSSVLQSYDVERRPLVVKVQQKVIFAFRRILQVHACTNCMVIAKVLFPKLLFRQKWFRKYISDVMGMTQHQYNCESVSLGKASLPNGLAAGIRAPTVPIGLVDALAPENIQVVPFHNLLRGHHATFVIALQLPVARAEKRIETDYSFRNLFVSMLTNVTTTGICCTVSETSLDKDGTVQRENNFGRALIALMRLASRATRLLENCGVKTVLILCPPPSSGDDGFINNNELPSLFKTVAHRITASIGDFAGNNNLQIAWDIGSAFRQAYKLDFHKYQAPGAFIFIRPDGILSNQGVVGDFEAETTLYDSLSSLT